MPLSSVRVDGAPAEDGPLTHVWNVCVGAGRANEALRADWQEHFREAVRRLGMRSVRFHGLFHDDMFVYRDVQEARWCSSAPPPPTTSPASCSPSTGAGSAADGGLAGRPPRS